MRNITSPRNLSRPRTLHRSVLTYILAGACLTIGTPAIWADTTELITVGGGIEILTGNGHSHEPSVSGDGRYVALKSDASNLVSGDTNDAADIFVHDRDTGMTTRVSVDSTGAQSNNSSNAPTISRDGRYVAFQSFASNLVNGDTNEVGDIFVHDRDTGTTTRVSVDSAGVGGNSISDSPAISANGRYVAFESFASNLVSGDTNSSWDIFVHDRDSGSTTRVSLDSVDVQGNNHSASPAISADGRYVAFRSNANNLVSGDTNNALDIFVRDRDTSSTGRVSVDNAGVQGNAVSYNPAISADGRYVAFDSDANNLVSGDTNSFRDVFVHDRAGGITTRVSVGSDGRQGNGHSLVASISADGRYIAFASDASNLVSGNTNSFRDIFVHDRDTGATIQVSVDSTGSQGNHSSFDAAISADGRYVAYGSDASNLVSDDTNNSRDIFVHDRDTGTTDTATLAEAPWVGSNGGSFTGGISGDGRYVAFDSDANNLVSGDTNRANDIFMHDRVSGTTTRFSVDNAGVQGDSDSYDPAISIEGRYVAFRSLARNLVSGDTNFHNIFVHDRDSGVTTMVSVNSAGIQSDNDSYNPAISAAGRYVAFDSEASNLVSGDTNGFFDIFVHDRDSGTTTMVSVNSAGIQSDNDSFEPAISAAGRYVAFESDASNLVSGDTNGFFDIFVHDRDTGTTTRVSVDNAGAQGNSVSYDPAISLDGRYIAFESVASNLVDGDTNNAFDIFVHDRNNGETTRVSVNSGGFQGNDFSRYPAISSDGRYVAFQSAASNLVEDDTNEVTDVFVHDRYTGITMRVSVDNDGVQGNGDSQGAAISADGMSVAFTSWADNLDSAHQISVKPQVYVFTTDDTDGDGHFDAFDNCVTIPNGGQVDTDRDGIGNICDADFNDDCLVNFLDLATMRRQFFTNDSSPIWDPDVDLNNDGAVNFVDLLVMRSGFFAPPGPSNMPNICEPGCGLRGRAFDPTEHFGVELFARGSFNQWGSAPPYNLRNYGDGVYRTQVEVGAAEHELKIADENWTLEYDAPTRLLLDVPLVLDSGSPGSPNISLNLEQNGCYNFRIEPVDSGTPPAQVELVVNRKP